jgi:hypothetical protein
MAHDDLIWLSGLLEGEGSFDLHKGRYPRVRVAMADRDVVTRAAGLMGCRVRLTLRPAPYLGLWHAEVSGLKGAALMREVLPHMGARRSAKIAGILGHSHTRWATSLPLAHEPVTSGASR